MVESMPNKPIRVLFNDRCLHGPRAGVGHYVAELLDHLPKTAPDVQMLPFYRTWLNPQRTGQTSEHFGSSKKSADRRPPWWLRHTTQMVYETGMRLFGRWKGCHIYHEPNHIPTRFDGPIVTTIHDLSVLLHPHWHPADRVRWYEKEFRRSLSRCAHFIAVSHFTRNEMVKTLGLRADQITVIPLGIRPIFRPRPTDNVRNWLRKRCLPTRFILYAGTIEPRKNVEGLLAAYARLDRITRQACPLVLAGQQGWGMPPIAGLIEAYHLADHVRVLGHVDEETLAYLYAGANMMVWPSFYEGFGLPPIECMACGTPVITSNAGSLPEITSQAALHVDPQDTEAIC